MENKFIQTNFPLWVRMPSPSTQLVMPLASSSLFAFFLLPPLPTIIQCMLWKSR